jgi:meso-butanediol dehydrogenase / (S,S)-butanediol dehydrogenase / diacetyl reductase
VQRFADKVALVTAAAQGIGAAVARRIVAEGGAVVVTDLQQDKLDELVAELGSDQALAVKVDVTSREEIDAAVAAGSSASAGWTSW